MAACDGRTIAPKVRLEVSISKQEVGELRELLAEFARAEEFVVEDLGPKMPPRFDDGKRFTLLRLIRGDTMQVVVEDFLPANLFHVYIYDMDSDPRFDQTASKLEAMLREKWPGQVAHMTGR